MKYKKYNTEVTKTLNKTGLTLTELGKEFNILTNSVWMWKKRDSIPKDKIARINELISYNERENRTKEITRDLGKYKSYQLIRELEHRGFAVSSDGVK